MSSVYRELEFAEPCNDCEAPSTFSCSRCDIPHCADHTPQSNNGWCDDCERGFSSQRHTVYRELVDGMTRRMQRGVAGASAAVFILCVVGVASSFSGGLLDKIIAMFLATLVFSAVSCVLWLGYFTVMVPLRPLWTSTARLRRRFGRRRTRLVS